ncbi:biogenesis of lysosome-related organelles complex 1 subunit 2 [Athalia rosae]|uniref:biogenesis of lysosome-related organelles complex 1 subunit 2 n=1 Tax=Athalia rosae TaxID=37344 RepID=UPI000626B993|nr:biogenesis of lysosome-related organelles complex 1 subunit 2 [Athalia rosae]
MTSIKNQPKKEDTTLPEPSSQDTSNFDEMDENLRCESPKRGTTLSTSTSSFEALDPHDPNLSRLANMMFQKTGEYLQEELTSTHADYRLLERLNKEAIGKYAELKTISSNISHSLEALNSKYRKLQPVLDNINEIDDSVTKLEQAAYKLAAYSKRLEMKFKEIEKESKSK